MRNAPPIVPCPMCADEGVERLVFPDTLDDGMPGCLIVAALDVEVAQQGLEDQGGQQCNPSLQQVDESGVGAELLEELCGEASLKEPCSMSLPQNKDDCAEAVVHAGIVLRLPSLGDGVARSEALPIDGVVGIGVDYREMSDSGFSGYLHGPTMRYDVHQGVEGCFGWLVERGLVAVGPRIDGLEGGPADFAEQPASEKVTFTSHPPSHVGI